MDKSTFKKIIFLIFFTVFSYHAVQNIKSILNFFQNILDIIHPILLSFFLAYVLNIPMRFFEKHLFDQTFFVKLFGVNKTVVFKNEILNKYFINVKKSLLKFINSVKRPISLCLSLTLLFFLCYIIFILVLPQFVEALAKFLASLPIIFLKMTDKLNSIFESTPEIQAIINEKVNIIYSQVESLKNYIDLDTILKTINSGLSIIVFVGNTLSGFFLTLIMAIYILLSKELLARQWNRFAKAYLPENLNENKILPFVRLVDDIFSSYFSGQFLDACVLGTMVMLSMLLFKIPYVFLIGVCVIVFAMLPLIGAFISGALGFFIILTVNPAKALVFLVIAVICQQIEGNLIYPFIVGKSVSLPAIWVIIALTIGGSLAGFSGIFISIPVFSVIYNVISASIRTRIYENVKQKRLLHSGHRILNSINDHLDKGNDNQDDN